MTVVPVVVGGGVAWTEELCDVVRVGGFCEEVVWFSEVLDSADLESVSVDDGGDEIDGPVESMSPRSNEEDGEVLGELR